MTWMLVAVVGTLLIVGIYDLVRGRAHNQRPFTWSCPQCRFSLASSDAGTTLRYVSQHERGHQGVAP